jgi:hypothetical protein
MNLRSQLASGAGLKVLVGAILAAGLTFGFFWLRERQFEAQLAVLKLKNDEQRAQIDRLIGALNEQNKQLTASALALEQVNRRLVTQNQQLVEQIRLLRAESERQIAAIPSLTSTQIAVETTRTLYLAEGDIQPQAPEGLLFNDRAGRANLKGLLEGQAALAELPIANQRITNLGLQVQNLETALVDTRQIVSNKDQELKLQADRFGLREGELKKEVRVVKAQGRKHNFIWAALSFIGGVIVAAL